MSTIEAVNICKSFGEGQRRTMILRGVSMSVQPGETAFLVGPSGSGKTTLLSILGCILKPDAGRLHVLGEDIGTLTVEQLTEFRRRHIGFVFQSFNLFPTLSALDNVRLTLVMRGSNSIKATKQATELLQRLGLGHRLALKPGKLSTGECQRVAIARALADEPRLLFADEPTAALDAENGQAVMKLMTGLARERKVTLVVVTHDNRIFPFADRIVNLEDGRLTHAWTPDAEHKPASHAPPHARSLPAGRLRFLKELVR